MLINYVVEQGTIQILNKFALTDPETKMKENLAFALKIFQRKL